MFNVFRYNGKEFKDIPVNSFNNRRDLHYFYLNDLSGQEKPLWSDIIEAHFNILDKRTKVLRNDLYKKPKETDNNIGYLADIHGLIENALNNIKGSLKEIKKDSKSIVEKTIIDNVEKQFNQNIIPKFFSEEKKEKQIMFSIYKRINKINENMHKKIKKHINKNLTRIHLSVLSAKKNLTTEQIDELLNIPIQQYKEEKYIKVKKILEKEYKKNPESFLKNINEIFSLKVITDQLSAEEIEKLKDNFILDKLNKIDNSVFKEIFKDDSKEDNSKNKADKPKKKSIKGPGE